MFITTFDDYERRLSETFICLGLAADWHCLMSHHPKIHYDGGPARTRAWDSSLRGRLKLDCAKYDGPWIASIAQVQDVGMV